MLYLKKYLKLLLIIIFFGCNKDRDEVNVSKTMNIEAISNGTIINSTPREILNYFEGPGGKELRIGWTEDGYSMRSFVSFKISQMLPPSGKELIINSAWLKVYESNTNLFPFEGDGGNRNVLVSLFDYKELDESDFDAPVSALCGIIASGGYNVLQAYLIDVTDAVSNYYQIMPDDHFRFRLQFNADTNVVNLDNTDLDGSMWNIFAGEDDSEYVPVLEVEYTHKAK